MTPSCIAIGCRRPVTHELLGHWTTPIFGCLEAAVVFGLAWCRELRATGAGNEPVTTPGGSFLAPAVRGLVH